MNKEIIADKVVAYIDMVKSEIYYCMKDYNQMDRESKKDAVDIAVRLYYLQVITNDLIEDLRKGGEM
jgi:hypothetical protein